MLAQEAVQDKSNEITLPHNYPPTENRTPVYPLVLAEKSCCPAGTLTVNVCPPAS